MTPVTLLTGFLGAGKTTLLRRLLAEIGGARTVVVENEFGAANLDSELLENIQPGMVRRVNGCICCTVVGDLWHTFSALDAARREGTIEFDRVIVETTGMAEPSGLVNAFYRNDGVQDAFQVDAVVTVVDASNALVDLQNSPTAQAQVALADVLVVNKTDLVDGDARARLSDRLGEANPFAEVHEAVYGAVPSGVVLGRALFDAARLPDPAHSHEPMGSVLVEDGGPHDLRRVRGWLRRLVAERPYDFYRYKGIVRGAREQRVFVQGVHETLATEHLSPWGARARNTRFVFIGIDLDEAQLSAGLVACRAKRAHRPA